MHKNERFVILKHARYAMEYGKCSVLYIPHSTTYLHVRRGKPVAYKHET